MWVLVRKRHRRREGIDGGPLSIRGSSSRVSAAGVCMVGRMPRMQVYLPDDLYRAVKERHLPASELLQEAVAAELRRRRLNEEADRYLAELVGEVGEPSARERGRAEAVARRIRARALQREAG